MQSHKRVVWDAYIQNITDASLKTVKWEMLSHAS